MRLADRGAEPAPTRVAQRSRRRRGPGGAFHLRPSRQWGWSAVVALAYGLATVVMTWPYAAHLASHTPPTGDPLLQVWIARWVQHALVTDPLHLYDANAFYPLEHTLAYSDSNVPAALLMAPLFLLTGNAILAYNLVVLGTFVLAAGGMYALVGRLTGNRAAGFLAGLAYAFLPYRFAHIWHLNQLGHAWTPWVLLALALLIGRPSWRAALAFGLLFAVQVLTSFYLAFQIALAVGLALLVAAVAEPRVRTVRFLSRLAAAGALAAALILPLALPYIQVREQQGLERTLDDVRGWEATPRSYLTTDQYNRVWGWMSEERTGENALFPGGLALLGAAIGLAGSRRRPALTVATLLIGGAAAVLSLGPTWHSTQGGTTPLPYHYLFDHLPLFKAMRQPARFGVLADFAIVTLAGLGAAWTWEWLVPRLPPARHRTLGVTLAIGLGLLILIESYSAPVLLRQVDQSPEVAAAYRWLARQPGRGAVMEFPAVRRPRETATAMYWSTVYWKPLVQGYSGFQPRLHREVLNAFTGDLKRLDGTAARDVNHVNADNVGYLLDLGVRYLVLHRSSYQPEDWPAALARLEATGQVEQAGDFGEAVVYRVRAPDPAEPAVGVSLLAPAQAAPQVAWEPTVVVHNPKPRWALFYVKRPLKLTVTWRDEQGRTVRRDVRLVKAHVVVPPGESSCSPQVCRPAGPANTEPGPPLYPPAPGRYTVQIDLTGDHTVSHTLTVEVAAPSVLAGPTASLHELWLPGGRSRCSHDRPSLLFASVG